MTDTPALPPPDEPADGRAEITPPTRPARKRNWVPTLYAAAFVILAAAVIWIWQNPNPSPKALRPEQIAALVNQVENLTIRIEKLESEANSASPEVAKLQKQVADLESRQPAATDLGPLQRQIDDLKQQLAAQPQNPQQAQGDGAGLQQQIAALQQQVQAIANKPQPPPPDLGPLETRLNALEKRLPDVSNLQTQAETASAQRAAMSQRLDAVAQRLDTNASANQARDQKLGDLESSLRSQSGDLDNKLSVLQQKIAQANATADKAGRLVRIEGARIALNSGQKLGSLPDAPPALARFQDQAPPTEASLRLSFPKAADAALAASRPNDLNQPFGQRVLDRAQSLITIRQGDRVVVGDPASGLIATAQTRLDAGDLQGAVAAVSQLSGPAAQAMAPWLDQAKSLLAARQALDTMTGPA